MNYKELSEKLLFVLSKYKSILIYIKGSPDPDVIASSYALKIICDNAGIKSTISCSTKPSLPQNSAIIKDLDIPIRFEDPLDNLSEYDAYTVLDFQSAFIDGITGKIPCIIHIDHHEPIDEDIKIDFKLIMDEAGSISSFFSLIIKEQNMSINSSLLKKVTTALQYGIFTDTDGYRHANKIDFEALNYLSNYYDKKIIDHVTKIPVPKHVISLLSLAISNKEEYKDWIFTGIGFIDESERDSIPIIADFLMQRFNCSVIIVFAAVARKKPHGLRLDASFRTEDENINLDLLIKRITRSGGGRKYKGAYQVDMNYFVNCPDKNLLWDVIKCATIARLKDLRDEIQLIKINGIYKKVIKKAENIFK